MEVKISIITINYNNSKWLQQTFDSVRAQTLKGIDYVVIDGGSTDGSKTIIEKNNDIISFWCSEKYKGIYDAQNKGILKSKSNYLVFLNAGDLFAFRTSCEFHTAGPKPSFCLLQVTIHALPPAGLIASGPG